MTMVRSELHESANTDLPPGLFENLAAGDLDELKEEIEHHEVFRNAYFDQLQHSRFTRATYDLHRANFFYRTEFTVKAIAHVCASAADRDDEPTLILFSHILDEECGHGDPKRCHSVLMERAHNLFGGAVFGLDHLPVHAARNSALIVDGTRRYRQRIQELSSASYPRLLGVAMAMESHAEKMLTHCRTAFRAHAGYFENSQFVGEVEVYFNVHLDEGVEERHAADAVRCVRGNCRTHEDFAEVVHGAREALKVQLTMWEELFKRRTEIERGLNG
jgi:Iron-containing redox enzyme